MLTKYDEMLCHQVATTFDHPGTSAREWTERIWFMAYDTTGDHILVAGFGYYPNRNVMDAFVMDSGFHVAAMVNADLG